MRWHSVLVILLGFAALPALGYWAFDTLDALGNDSVACFKKEYFTASIFRLYSPVNDGSVDEVGIANIKLAVASRTILTEAYIEPSLSGTKSAIKQYREAMKGLKDAKVEASRIWLKVTSPYFWGRAQSRPANVEFIADFIEEGRLNGVKVGIFTNWYDWEQITKNSTQIESTVIWYWQASGQGTKGFSQANFRDYVKFGGMPDKPTLKQYGLSVRLCNANINRNGYDYLPDDFGFSMVGDGVAEAQILRNNLANINGEFNVNTEEEIAEEPLSPSANAFDFNGLLLDSEAKCLKRAGYAVGAFQVYTRGVMSTNLRSVQYALSAGLNVELTLDPSPEGKVSAATQYTTIVKALSDAKFRVRRLWLRVTDPFDWGVRSQAENVQFINEFIEAADKDDIYVGIYTNWYDWQQITGNSNEVSPHSLWYWQSDPNGRSDPNFGDFVEFGKLPRPLMKRYIHGFPTCYTQVNRDLTYNGFREAQEENFIPFGEGVSTMA